MAQVASGGVGRGAEVAPFVSLVAANSETGVIQDVDTAVDLVAEAGGLILVDATQALGKITMPSTPDYLAVSAHKIGGPKGIGALYVAPSAPFTPLLSGGGQERRRRSGTHNVSGIAGFGAACAELINLEHTRELRDILEKELKAIEPNIVFFGEGADRLPNTSFFAVPDASSMTLMMGARFGRRLGFHRNGLLIRQGRREPRHRRHGPHGAGPKGRNTRQFWR